IATYTSLLSYTYHTFNMADDTWGVVNELIETPTNAPTFPWISIAVKSNGVPVVAYAGDTDQVMGGKKERVDVNVRNGGTWDGPIALDAAGDIHYGNPNVVKSPLTDEMHVLWQKTSNTTDPPAVWTDVEARTLDPADDSLSTVDTLVGDTAGNLLGLQNGASYDDADTQRVIWCSIGTNTDLNNKEFFQAVEDAGEVAIACAAAGRAHGAGLQGDTWPLRRRDRRPDGSRRASVERKRALAAR
ncbi:MAG: hypothetical protein IH822_10135, partial [Chloroflexi bacterium]|nr:hypothetical protein [Chloroflexota bacterium]